MGVPISTQPASAPSDRAARRVVVRITPRARARRAPRALPREARNVIGKRLRMIHLRPILICLVASLLSAGCRRTLRHEEATVLEAPPGVAPAPEQAGPAEQGRLSIETGFAPVVERVAGAVVNISSTRVVRPPAPEQLP